MGLLLVSWLVFQLVEMMDYSMVIQLVILLEYYLDAK